MDPQSLQSMIRELPEIASWPDLAALVDRPVPFTGVSAWDYPMIGCSAVGGAIERAMPAAAAILCSLVSIRLVDDILDDDPNGEFRKLGEGRAANMALALQAAGHQLLERSPAPSAARLAAHTALSGLALRTALGQDLDCTEARDEADYWRKAEGKSSPMFSVGLALGAILSESSTEVIAGLARIGALLGKLIQISDDMFDAMSTPARPDWRRPRNNLALLFAIEVEHAARDRFLELLPLSADPAKLREAQGLLVSSGAISYCVFKLVETARAAQNEVRSLHLAQPAKVLQLIAINVEPARRALARVGLDLPADLSNF